MKWIAWSTRSSHSCGAARKRSCRGSAPSSPATSRSSSSSRRDSMRTTSTQIAQIVRDSLGRGRAVEIDGLGAFRPDPRGGFRFEPQTRPKVFLAYAAEDHAAADRLYREFSAHGFDAWLD